MIKQLIAPEARYFWPVTELCIDGKVGIVHLDRDIDIQERNRSGSR
jgi:hypothetical protein